MPAGMGDMERGLRGLVDHDWLLIRRSVVTALAGWHDRFLAIVLVATCLAVAHQGLAERTPRQAMWIAMAIGATAGVAASRALADRLRYHVGEGALAALALQRACRHRYLIACHAAIVAVFAAAMAIVRADTIPVVCAAYLTAATGGAVDIARTPVPSSGWRRAIDRRLLSWQRRPAAGVVAAVLTLIVTLAAPTDDSARLAVCALASCAVIAVLTRVEPAVVRFLALSGHGLGSILLRRAAGGLTFLFVAPVVASVAVGLAGAVVVGSVIAGMLVLMALRIQAHRLYARLQAELIVAMLVFVIAMAVLLSPFVALPVAALAVWRLSRAAAHQRWMIG